MSSYARKRSLYVECGLMSEDFDEGGMRTLAGAICCLAAGAHTKDNGEQQQMARILYEASRTGFVGIPPNEALEAYVASLFQGAGKKSK